MAMPLGGDFFFFRGIFVSRDRRPSYWENHILVSRTREILHDGIKMSSQATIAILV